MTIKLMKNKFKTSNFGSGNSELFLYLSAAKTNRVIIILKGLYGYHFPLDKNKTSLFGIKWEHSFIQYFHRTAHVICFNTSRIAKFKQEDFQQRRESFEGKEYETELTDTRIIFSEAKTLLLKMGIQYPKFHLIGKSFGGTVLLGLPEIVHVASSVHFLGSGCGRDPDTKKPLLKSLYNESTLLKTVEEYKGYLTFFIGSDDTVVPIESQEKIIKASGAVMTKRFEIKGADHEFEKINNQESLRPNKIIRNIIFNSICISELNVGREKMNYYRVLL